MALALSISEMGEKSSQIGTQTQIEIAGLEVIQYQNDNHRKHIHPWNQSMTTVFVFNTISCVSILGLMLSIWYFNRAVDTTHCETMHFVFPNVYIFLGWEQQIGPNFGGRGGDCSCPWAGCRWRRNSPSHIWTRLSTVLVGLGVQLGPKHAQWGTTGLRLWWHPSPISSFSFWLQRLEFRAGHDQGLSDGGKRMVTHFDPN